MIGRINIPVSITILANLILGNLILYFHEIYGRHQTEVATSLWASFSLVAVVLLLVSVRILKTKISTLGLLLLSLTTSFLIPLLGFFIAMEISLVGLFTGAVYLFFGFFYFVFPMWILNFMAFRWIQKSINVSTGPLSVN